MNRALWLVALTLLASPRLAPAETDSRAAREEILRVVGGEHAANREASIEALGTSELIVNGGFEAGQAPGPATGYSATSGSWSWTTSNGGQNPVWTDGPSHTGPPTARTGAWCVYFSPIGPASNTISQSINIPSGTTATLSFWIKISTLESSGMTAADTLTVRLKSKTGSTLATLATYSNLDPTPGFGYVQKSFNVSSWAGQTVKVFFESYSDATRSTAFVFDDVSLTATTGGTEPAGAWVLPSSARVSGEGAFWKTDLILLNQGSEAASVTLKFLGHGSTGAAGPERTYSIPPKGTTTYADVLSTVFDRQSDWGPILIRSAVTTLSVQARTWTASPTGGSYGQSVPALGTAEWIGTAAKPIVGVRQDASFRTNLVLANPKDSATTVNVALVRPDGSTAASKVVELGPYGFSQLSIATDFKVSSIVNGSFLINCTTADGQVVAYASVIDAVTADPRTILAR